jgi:hypothetical protein
MRNRELIRCSRTAEFAIELADRPSGVAVRDLGPPRRARIASHAKNDPNVPWFVFFPGSK